MRGRARRGAGRARRGDRRRSDSRRGSTSRASSTLPRPRATDQRSSCAQSVTAGSVLSGARSGSPDGGAGTVWCAGVAGVDRSRSSGGGASGRRWRASIRRRHPPGSSPERLQPSNRPSPSMPFPFGQRFRMGARSAKARAGASGERLFRGALGRISQGTRFAARPVDHFRHFIRIVRKRGATCGPHWDDRRAGHPRRGGVGC